MVMGSINYNITSRVESVLHCRYEKAGGKGQAIVSNNVTRETANAVTNSTSVSYLKKREHF